DSCSTSVTGCCPTPTPRCPVASSTSSTASRPRSSPGAVDPMSEITVIGAGASGLGTAYRLSADHRVTALEAGTRAGGCLKQTALGGDVPVGLEAGAEASPNRRPETRELAAELGLQAVFPSTAHSSQVLNGAALHPIPKRTIMGVPAEAAEV